MESGFDLIYLVFAICVGLWMIFASRKLQDPKERSEYSLFGWMALVLGSGDAFHLVPRMIALWAPDGFTALAAPLGIGKMITSITMTLFYILLYLVWKKRYAMQDTRILDWSMYGLAALRIILCLMPQNQWTSVDEPLSWGIIRNIPFLIMGIIVIVLFYRSAREHHDSEFKWMWLTIVLSFAFYLPVVLFASTCSWVGMLMIPKTCAYVWTIWIGFAAMRKTLNAQNHSESETLIR